MTDYATLLDEETKAFIARTDSWYPPETATFSVAQQRQIYDRMCREFFAGYPEGVTAEDIRVPTPTGGVPARVYSAAKADDAAVIVYYHGGGFVVGGLESHDDVCAELCARTGFEVVSVDYRLAPEHKHPAAFADALEAFMWVAGRDDRPVLLMGDSAGGNLAAAVAHATRGKARSAIGQVLIYPGLGGDMTRGSYVTHANAPMLTMRDMEIYRDIRTDGSDHSADPTFAPLADPDFSGLPPTVLITAECDPLSSDGEAYRDRVRAAGGKAWWKEEKGLVHGYLRARHSVGRARESFDRIVEAAEALGHGRWPY